MKNKGSGIWWFIGIALALVWAFSANTDSDKQKATQLDNHSDGFQLLNPGQVQVQAPDFQSPSLPLHMQQPLETSPAVRIAEPVRTHEPDLHMTQQPTETEEVLPFVDLSETMPDRFVNTTAEPEMLTELKQAPEYDELSDFNELSQPNEQPMLPATAPSEVAAFEDGMTNMDFVNVSALPAIDELAEPTKPSVESFPETPGSKVVSNPFFSQDGSAADASPLPGANQPQKIKNQFINEMGQADLFADHNSQTAPTQKAEAQFRASTETEFASFEDLRNDQDQWASDIGPVQVSGNNGDRLIASEINPMVAPGENLQLAPASIQRCVNHIEQGKSLAKRRAAFAAREEFFSALRVIAQSHDAQTMSKRYTAALTRAVVALQEADDFYAQGNNGIDVDVLMVVEGHESKIIPKDIAGRMSSLAAIQTYFDYARQNFHAALGEGPVASEALYSLGKLFTLSATHQLSGNPFDYAKSTVMHYAALDCDPQNYRSSNELGVLMARNGRLEKSRDLLRDSLIAHQHPETWRNLAKVHEKLALSPNPEMAQNNRELAQMANQEYSLALQQVPAPISRVQWVAPEEYNGEQSASFSEARVAELPQLPAIQAPQKRSLIQTLFR